MNESSTYPKDSQRVMQCWEHDNQTDNEWTHEGNPNISLTKRE